MSSSQATSDAHPMQLIHKNMAIWSMRQLKFLRPELKLSLHGSNYTFIIYIENCPESEFPSLSEFFSRNLRPITCDITLTHFDDKLGPVVEQEDSYESELWLNDVPLSGPDLNNLMFLAEPNLPTGEIDFDHGVHTWVFSSPNALTDADQAKVQKAATKVGIRHQLRFVATNRSHPPSTYRGQPVWEDTKLDLIMSRDIGQGSGVVKDLIEQDEDDWRVFLRERASQETVNSKIKTSPEFACLYDAEHCGETRLSELLTLYDRVDILPERNDLGWSSKHQVPLQDLQELIRLKRVRIILPYSANQYPSQLVEQSTEADASSVILSRSLAAQTITHGQYKDPLLYAPLTSNQRASLLHAMHQIAKNDNYRELVKNYGELFSREHDTFMMRGAVASYGYGVGTYIGDAFFKLRDKDARIELSICGARIEWALALGASYIPMTVGDYDETSNSQIIASFLGRAHHTPANPLSNRIHTITDGLLSVSGVPPLEVAKNFHSLPASRFRNVARKLMSASATEDDLKEAITQINSDVVHFERRADRISRWKVGALLAPSAEALVTQGVPFATGASIVAKWAYNVLLNDKIPAEVRDELEDAWSMLQGLSTGSSLDAIVVSRTRKRIGNT